MVIVPVPPVTAETPVAAPMVTSCELVEVTVSPRLMVMFEVVPAAFTPKVPPVP